MLSMERPQTSVKLTYIATTRTGQKMLTKSFLAALLQKIQHLLKKTKQTKKRKQNKTKKNPNKLQTYPWHFKSRQTSSIFLFLYITPRFGVSFFIYVSLRESFKFSWCRLYVIPYWCLIGIQTALDIEANLAVREAAPPGIYPFMPGKWVSCLFRHLLHQLQNKTWQPVCHTRTAGVRWDECSPLCRYFQKVKDWALSYLTVFRDLFLSH